MRKAFLYSAAMLGLLMATTGCERNGKKNTETTLVPDTIHINWEYKDTVKRCPIACFMNGSLPRTENSQFKKIMNEWINERLGGTYKMGNNQSTDSIMVYYQHAWADSAKAQINEYITDDRHTIYSWENTFNVEVQTDKFISLAIKSYSFEGGAHGSSKISQQTFRKEDGREFGWNNMFNETNKYQLRELLTKKIMEYFHVNSETELKECLLNPDDTYLIPLPETPPMMLGNGIRFVYQQYEIAPYAAGMPSFVLPYSEVKSLLTTSASDLLEQ